MIEAFSIEMISAGSFSLINLAFLDSLIRIFIVVIFSVIRIQRLIIPGSHVFYHKSKQNLFL